MTEIVEKILPWWVGPLYRCQTCNSAYRLTEDDLVTARFTNGNSIISIDVECAVCHMWTFNSKDAFGND